MNSYPLNKIVKQEINRATGAPITQNGIRTLNL